MLGLKKLDLGSISEYFDKRSKRSAKKKDLLKSRVDQVLHGDHEHYFSKQEYQANKHSARCKICGILLSEYLAEVRLKERVAQLQSGRPAEKED